MASRRPRLQIRPNVAAKSKDNSETKKSIENKKADETQQTASSPRRRRTSSQTVDSKSQDTTPEISSLLSPRSLSIRSSPRKRTSSATEQSEKILADSNAKENKETACKTDSAPPSGIGRRSRIKPAVCVGRRGRGNAKQDAESTDAPKPETAVQPVTIATLANGGSDVQEASEGEFTQIQSRSEITQKELHEVSAGDSSKSTTSAAECAVIAPSVESTNGEGSSGKPPASAAKHPEVADTSTGSTEQNELTLKQTSTQPPLKRSRFMKAKPNLAEASRSRLRQTSTSDLEEDSVLKSPPPVQRQVSFPVLGQKDTSDCEASIDDAAVQAVPSSTTKDDATTAAAKPTEPTPKRVIRKMLALSEPVDRSKVTMKDLIYMNPKDNPMKNFQKKKKTPAVQPVSDTAVPDKQQETADVINVEVEMETEEAVPVPQVKIGPDGSIIVNEQSLVIDSPQSKTTPITTETIDETDMSFTDYNWSNRPKASRKHWTNKETKKFYVALSMIGTDFTMLSQLFPNRSRLDIKRKFKKEERIHPQLIDKALKEKRGFNMSLLDDPDTSSDEEHPLKAKENKPTKKPPKSKPIKAANQNKAQAPKTKGKSNKEKPVKQKKSKKRSRFYDSSSDEDDELDLKGADNDKAGMHGSDEEEMIGSHHDVVTQSGRKVRQVITHSRQTSPVPSEDSILNMSVVTQPSESSQQQETVSQMLQIAEMATEEKVSVHESVSAEPPRLADDTPESEPTSTSQAVITEPFQRKRVLPKTTLSIDLTKSPLKEVGMPETSENTLGSPSLRSPPPVIRLPLGEGTSGSQFVPLSDLGVSIPQLDMDQMPPGQLIVVPENTGCEGDQPVMHVFMVSAPLAPHNTEQPGINEQQQTVEVLQSSTQQDNTQTIHSTVADASGSAGGVVSVEVDSDHTSQTPDRAQSPGQNVLTIEVSNIQEEVVLDKAEIISRRLDDGTYQTYIEPKFDTSSQE